MKDDKMLEAKKEVLKELLMEAMQEMKSRNKRGLDEAKSMQKVSVMAPDKDGLKKGLAKAEDALDMMPEQDEDMSMDKEHDIKDMHDMSKIKDMLSMHDKDEEDKEDEDEDEEDMY